MPFYIITFDCTKEEFPSQYLEHFNSENDVNKFVNSHKCNKCKVIIQQPITLYDLLLNLNYDLEFGIPLRIEDAEYEDLVSIQLYFVKRFGIDLIKREYPAEEFTPELRNKIREETERLVDETLANELQAEHEQSNKWLPEPPTYEHYYGEDEIKRMDEEDPSWRDANDFG